MQMQYERNSAAVKNYNCPLNLQHDGVMSIFRQKRHIFFPFLILIVL